MSGNEGVIITVEIVIKPEVADAVCAGIPQMFADTVTFEGFRSIRVHRHKDQPNRVMIIEHWDREDQYQAYQDWRGEDAEKRAETFAQLESYEANVWPAFVGAAFAGD